MRSSGAGRLWPAAALVALVFAGAVAFVVWQRYTLTPQYATLKAVQAMSDRDWAAFSEWVDVPQVVRTAIAAETSGTIGGTLLRDVPGANDALVPAVERLVRLRVEQGVPQIPPHVPFPVLLFSGVVRGASVVDDDAYVTAETTGKSAPLRLEVRLRRTAGRWRIVELRNAAALLSDVP